VKQQESLLTFVQELKTKPWKFDESHHPGFDNENKSFLENLNSYLDVSRDIEGYVRILKSVNEKIYPFCGEYSDWIESILIQNSKSSINSLSCPDRYLNPECKQEPTATALRSLNYEIIRELKLLQILLEFLDKPLVELVEESSKTQYQYLKQRLEQLKNEEGQDISAWSVSSSTGDIADGIAKYQRLLSEAKGYSNSAIRLLERASVRESVKFQLLDSEFEKKRQLEATEIEKHKKRKALYEAEQKEQFLKQRLALEEERLRQKTIRDIEEIERKNAEIEKIKRMQEGEKMKRMQEEDRENFLRRQQTIRNIEEEAKKLVEIERIKQIEQERRQEEEERKKIRFIEAEQEVRKLVEIERKKKIEQEQERLRHLEAGGGASEDAVEAGGRAAEDALAPSERSIDTISSAFLNDAEGLTMLSFEGDRR
jgi:hypothetical protein